MWLRVFGWKLIYFSSLYVFVVQIQVMWLYNSNNNNNNNNNNNDFNTLHKVGLRLYTKSYLN